MASRHPDNTMTSRSPSFWAKLTGAALSLQCTATGLVVVLSLAVAAVVSGYLVRSSAELARRQEDRQMVQLAAMLAKAAEAAMSSADAGALASLAAESANGNPLIYVVLSDTTGRRLAAAEQANVDVLGPLARDGRDRAGLPGTPVLRRGIGSVPVFLDVTYPITRRLVRAAARAPSTGDHSQALLGYVRTGVVADGWQRTMSSRLDLVVGVGILACLAAVPLGFLLIRRIIRPLDHLAVAMRRFSEGELDVRSDVRRRDEIGRLALAFDRMADQHQHTHLRLVRMNTELERRVGQRTKQLRELASRDPLTGLYNRRRFNEALENRFSEATRYGTDLSCMMIDLDGFKAVNDEFGHQIGDDLLVIAAITIPSQLRAADMAARFGGDEFIVLLPHTDAESAGTLGERIVGKFAEDAREQLPQVQSSMSIGIASVHGGDAKDAESLIRAADRALYDAKAAGKNRVAKASSSPDPAAL